MLQEKPTRRISASEALKVATEVLAQDEMEVSKSTRKEKDGPYFHFVMEEMDTLWHLLIDALPWV
jgi:hypothetical protein